MADEYCTRCGLKIDGIPHINNGVAVHEEMWECIVALSNLNSKAEEALKDIVRGRHMVWCDALTYADCDCVRRICKEGLKEE